MEADALEPDNPTVAQSARPRHAHLLGALAAAAIDEHDATYVAWPELTVHNHSDAGLADVEGHANACRRLHDSDECIVG